MWNRRKDAQSSSASRPLPAEFLEWQVKLRAWTMHESHGAPHAGVAPLLVVRQPGLAVGVSSHSIICGLLPAPSVLDAKTVEFRALYEAHIGGGARAVYDQGIAYLKEYYEDAAAFDAGSITTLLPRKLPVVDALRAEAKCALVFYVFDLVDKSEVGRLRCLHVDCEAEVLESGPVYDNVWWHNTLFHGPADEHVVIHFKHRGTWDTRFGALDEVGVVIRILIVALVLGLAPIAGAAESASQAVTAHDQLPPAASERTLADWYAMGGWVMHFLVACSVIAFAIGLERAFSLRPGAVAPRRLSKALAKAASAGDAALLEEHVRKSSASLASLGRVAWEAWRRTGDRFATEEALEVAAGAETARLSRNLSLLSAVGNLATLLGLLGTVLGMIEAFETIASQGSSDAAVVAGGIFRALVTTAAGLSIGIFAFTLHALLRRRVESSTERLEDDLTELLDALESAGEPKTLAPSERGLEPQTVAS